MVWTVKKPETHRLDVPLFASGQDDKQYEVVPAEGVWVEIAELSRGRVAELIREAERAASESVTVEELKDGEVVRRVPEKRTDADKASAESAYLILAEGLMAWGGIEDADEKPIPCDAETQRMIFGDAPGFARWCMSVIMGAADAAAKREEDEAVDEANFRGDSPEVRRRLSSVA